MPAFELTSPDGKKYRVEGPEGATPEQAYDILQQQLKEQSGNTRGGDLARGVAHGAATGLGSLLLQVPGLGTPSVGELDPRLKKWTEEGAPEGASNWRKAGEAIGGAAPAIASGFIPGGPLVKTAVGAVTGALQPAKDWQERGQNTLIGGGSALAGQGVGKYVLKHAPALNKLANEAIGSTAGAMHLGPWGAPTGLWMGRNIGGLMQNLFGGRGLANLLAAAAKNPGLAAYLGIKASPYASQAGQFVGEELGKPSE